MISGSIADLAVIARSDSDDLSAEAQRAKTEAIRSDRAARWIASLRSQ
jgi:hypothetical protein